MEQQETAILIARIVLVLIIILLIILFTIFQKRKNSLLLQQQEAEKKFEKAIAQTQIEIKEETLRNISWELHDNIGQLLTLAKIQVNIAQDDPSKLDDAMETITNSLTELRSLSKIINPEAIKNLSLTEAITLEIERFNRLQFIEASITSNEATQPLDTKAEIILFRILQEFFTNTVKHSKATHLDVKVHYNAKKLVIQAEDNGIGYDIHEHSKKQGIGLSNMRNRGKLIGADIKLSSAIGKGTAMQLTYYYKTQKENTIEEESA